MARPRRLRRTPVIRDMVRETRLHPSDFIYPLFVRSGTGVKSEISAMPGNFHFSVDRLVEEAGAALEVSRAVAYRNWKYARAWLRDALEQ